MKPTCTDIDRFAGPAPGVGLEERELWHRHLEGCPRCRRQLAADGMLRSAFAAAPEPAFSDGFDAALARRLAARRPPPPLGLAAGILLAVYATAAAGLSVWILVRIEWAAVFSPTAIAVAVGLVALVTPLLVLPRASPFRPPGLS